MAQMTGRFDEIRTEERFSDACVEIIRCILTLALKKHLKALYHISNTAVAMASLSIDNPEIHKRDKLISGVQLKELSLPSSVLHIPRTGKELVALVKTFQSFTMTDPVENMKRQASAVRKKI